MLADLIAKAKAKTPTVVSEETEFGTIYLRALSGNAYDRVQDKLRGDNTAGWRAMLVAYSLCDEDGKQNAPPTPLQIQELGNAMDAGDLDRLADAALKVSKIGKDAREELEKNSEAATTADSG